MKRKTMLKLEITDDNERKENMNNKKIDNKNNDDGNDTIKL